MATPNADLGLGDEPRIAESLRLGRTTRAVLRSGCNDSGCAVPRGGLPPGTRVTEADVAADVAQELRVSRMPAREALRRLQQERLLVPTGARDGAKVRLAVAPMTAGEARELYAAAGALEGVVVRNVTEYDADERLALAAELARSWRRRGRPSGARRRPE